MRVYISGKIGEEVISDATRQKFAKAEKMLQDRGYDVFNPTQKDWQEELHRGYQRDSAIQPYGEKVTFYAYALLRDLMVLATCDAVYYPCRLGEVLRCRHGDELRAGYGKEAAVAGSGACPAEQE